MRSEAVVVDTRSRFVYLGRFAGVRGEFVAVNDVDVHDMEDLGEDLAHGGEFFAGQRRDSLLNLIARLGRVGDAAASRRPTP